MSSSDGKLIVADLYEAFSRARAECRDVFPKNLVTPEAILSEMRRKGVDSWDQIQRLGHLNRSDWSRATFLVVAELQKEIEGSM